MLKVADKKVLAREDQIRLRAIMMGWPVGANFNESFFQLLVKPPIDQPALFTEFGLEGKDRGQVVQIARQKLLQDPELVFNQPALEAAVRLDLNRSPGRT